MTLALTCAPEALMLFATVVKLSPSVMVTLVNSPCTVIPSVPPRMAVVAASFCVVRACAEVAVFAIEDPDGNFRVFVHFAEGFGQFCGCFAVHGITDVLAVEDDCGDRAFYFKIHRHDGHSPGWLMAFSISKGVALRQFEPWERQSPDWQCIKGQSGDWRSQIAWYV